MNVFESISSALSGIWGNKTRSLLTMFGIIVGISSVITIMSVGDGYKESLNQQFVEMGLDKLTVYPYSETETIEEADNLTYADVEFLRQYEELDLVAGYYYAYAGETELLTAGETRTVTFYGADAEFCQYENLDLLHGRSLLSQDMDSGSMAVVIDEDFAVQVFGRADVVGEKLEVETYFTGKLECDIVGVTVSDSSSQMYAMYNYNALVYMPLTTVMDMYGVDTVDEICVRVTDEGAIDRIGGNIVRLLELRHGNSDKYRVYSVAGDMTEADTVIGIFTLFLGVVAGISLLVGGIGVMNIMLVSVTERTREIGIRKSLGATNGNIQLQFLMESVIITAIGGGIGMLLGYLGGVGIGALSGMLLGESIVPYISAGTGALVVGISAGIGIVFGVYPAARAARLDPIESLRFE